MAHRRPQPARARSDRNVVPATVNRKITTRAYKFHHPGTSRSVDRKRSSGLDRKHLSRTSEPCHSESHAVGGSADALRRRWRGKRPSRRRPGRARGEKQGCTERRRFPAPCVNKRLPRPVQTGGGRIVTLSSTQLVALGRSSGSQGPQGGLLPAGTCWTLVS